MYFITILIRSAITSNKSNILSYKPLNFKTYTKKLL